MTANYVGLNLSQQAPGGATVVVPSSGYAASWIGTDKNSYITFSDGTIVQLATVGSAGTVTSVALALPSIFNVTGSPVTTSGTLTGALATQPANSVWAGPASGSAAAPTFRGLALADMPQITSKSLYGNITGGTAVPTAVAFSSITLDEWAAAAANLSLGGFLINNLGTPLASTDAVNKSYVDSLIQGIQGKFEAVAASTATLPAYTVGGSGATLTANANGAFPAQDGVTLTANQYFLLLNGASQVDQGLWQLTTVGSGSAPWVLTRPTAANNDWAVGVHAAGFYVFVNQGTVNGSNGFVCSAAVGSDVIGTSNLPFVQFTGAGEIIATTPLSKSGNTLSLTTVPATLGGTGSSTAPGSGQIPIGNAGGTAYAPLSMSGDATLASTGALTLATVNTNVGSFGSASSVSSFTVNGKGLITAASSVSISITPTQAGLGNVTNNAQTQAAIVPNTAPSAGQLLLGNAGGTAYAPVAMSGDGTITSAGAMTVTKSSGNTFGTAAFQNTGTSGANLPFLNGANTWSGLQTFNAAITAVQTSSATAASNFNTTGNLNTDTALLGFVGRSGFGFSNGTVVINDSPSGTTSSKQFQISLAGSVRFTILAIGNPGDIGIGGVTSPTAKLHIGAGTATAGTAPLQFTSGTNLTTAVAGTMEYDGTNLYFSPGTTRQTVALLGTTTTSAPGGGTAGALPALPAGYVSVLIGGVNHQIAYY